MQRLRRFARFWDLFGNSGNFVQSTPLLWQGRDSAFEEFMGLCDWIHHRTGRHHAIALSQLGELLFSFLTIERKLPPEEVAAVIWADYHRGGRSDRPEFLRPYLPAEAPSRRERSGSDAPKRQRRHLAAGS
jgi:hypothetical protein